MSPDDVKQWVDILSTLLAAGGGGGIILAVIGYMRAKMEKPHIADRPSIGAAGLASIGGMLMGQNDLKEMSEGLRAVATSYDRCTLTREAEMLARKKEVEETREHEKRLLEERRTHEQRLAEDRHREHREMVEAIQGLTRGARNIRCAG